VKDRFKLRTKCTYLVAAAGLVLAASQLSALAGTDPAAPSGTTAKTAAVPATTSTDTSDDTDYTNWVTLGAGGAFVNGNNGAYRHEHDTNNGAFGGVEDFHWSAPVNKETTFTMDGHGIFGNHDYDLKLDLTDDKIGYIRAGWKEFRTWYDSTGGYYPLTGLDFEPTNNELFVDRRSAWVEAGLTLPDLPVFTVRYEYDSREGAMDSTSWGQTTLNTPAGTQEKIVPTFLGIDETRNIFTADVTDTFYETTANLGMRYEIDKTNDSTYIDQNPDQSALNAFITQQTVEKNDLFSGHGSTVTVFDQKLTLSTGFAVTKMDTNIGGSRVYGPYWNSPVVSGFVNNGAGFINLGGFGNAHDSVANFNVLYVPIDNLTIIPSARIEYQDSNETDHFASDTGHPIAFTNESANTNNWELDNAQSLEARYTGFRDWSLYSSVESDEDWGNNSWNSAPILNTVNFNQDFTMIGLKATVGANWYPLSNLNFGGQYYHELHDYTYSNRNVVPGLISQYPGYLRKQNFSTDDGNIRCTWQALPTVSLVTRYDFQLSTVDTWGVPDPGTQTGGIESSTGINHILSEDVNWTPLPWLYLQAGGSYVINGVETPVAGSAGINNLIENGNNNYWTLDASAGIELDAKTHLQLEYAYFNADNYYVNYNVNDSMPFGADDIMNTVSATVTHQINKQVSVSLKYTYADNNDGTSGGQNNYQANSIYASTTFGF